MSLHFPHCRHREKSDGLGSNRFVKGCRLRKSAGKAICAVGNVGGEPYLAMLLTASPIVRAINVKTYASPA